MLNALRAAGAPTPQVLAVDPETLVLSCVDGGTGAGDAWASLGRALRALHSHCGDRYGWPHDYAFGALRIDNTPCANWPLFWAQCRLLPFVSRLPVSLVRRVEQLAASLGERLPAQPPAALLHGDLWGGNVLVHDHEVAALIDPACYYGDAEVDLAMLQLFDRPDPTFFAHYGPLRAGHVERLPIYRLWPALVHLTLFGDTYLPLVEAQLHDAGV